jgi:hypothetical protein
LDEEIIWLIPDYRSIMLLLLKFAVDKSCKILKAFHSFFKKDIINSFFKMQDLYKKTNRGILIHERATIDDPDIMDRSIAGSSQSFCSLLCHIQPC